MNWLYIGLVAYFLNAISFVVSKVMLKDLIPDPWVYTFFVNVLGALTVVLLPFSFFAPSVAVVLAALASGVTYVYALLILYKLLAREEASQVVPLTGGMTPIFVFLMAFFALGEFLNTDQLIGFALIVIGGFIVSHEESLKERLAHMGARLFLGSILAAVLFGASQVLMKFVFNNDTFINGFMWRGFGAVLGAAFLLFPKVPRRNIFKSFKKSNVKTDSIFIVGQIAALLSFILVNYAFSLGPVSLVNALSGIQYAFLFGFIVFLSKKYPKLLKEPLRPGIVRQKVISIVLITAGVAVLFV
ncbi:EamA family transporter [Patescibacteria group bacterium]|nr:EamA family transporter [Patescibacteria group bacterium]MCL5114405.1 EamA family transporter [Patescibacteria group bacterium]